MSLSPRTQAVLLLTAWLNKPAEGEPKPLTPSEWGRFAQWMKEKDIVPESLVETKNFTPLLAGFIDPSITSDRLRRLLERSAAMGLALEKWQRAGLWVVTRADANYPARLKAHLGINAPPLLFGCGNRVLLEQGGIAVIGSRNVDVEGLAFTTALAGEVALQGKSIVSGGARGVDEAAMLGALKKDGTVIGVLADSLLRVATSEKYRSGLMKKNLVLVSPFNPEAGFDVGNAMARNKYIYCLADAAVVIDAGNNKGGTWAGAVENLKQGWAPLWVKEHNDATSGNSALIKQGGRRLPEGAFKISSLITPVEKPPEEPLLPGLFEEKKVVPVCSKRDKISAAASINEMSTAYPETPQTTSYCSLYKCFLTAMKHETQKTPLNTEELQKRLTITKTQLNHWLKQAVSEGHIKTSGTPPRFQISMPGKEVPKS